MRSRDTIQSKAVKIASDLQSCRRDDVTGAKRRPYHIIVAERQIPVSVCLSLGHKKLRSYSVLRIKYSVLRIRYNIWRIPLNILAIIIIYFTNLNRSLLNWDHPSYRIAGEWGRDGYVPHPGRNIRKQDTKATSNVIR